MRIGFCGSMNTGKSTLVHALRDVPKLGGYKFQTERSKLLQSRGIKLNNDSTLLGQTVFMAERASELMSENIITDRTIIDIMAFTKCADSINYVDAEAFCDYCNLLLGEYDYLFYIAPEERIPLVSNGVRSVDPEYIKLIDTTINYYLVKYHHKIKNLIIIEGMTAKERVQFVLEHIFPDIYKK